MKELSSWHGIFRGCIYASLCVLFLLGVIQPAGLSLALSVIMPTYKLSLSVGLCSVCSLCLALLTFRLFFLFFALRLFFGLLGLSHLRATANSPIVRTSSRMRPLVRPCASSGMLTFSSSCSFASFTPFAPFLRFARVDLYKYFRHFVQFIHLHYFCTVSASLPLSLSPHSMPPFCWFLVGFTTEPTLPLNSLTLLTLHYPCHSGTASLWQPVYAHFAYFASSEPGRRRDNTVTLWDKHDSLGNYSAPSRSTSFW